MAEITADSYRFDRYVNPQRWASYWHQIAEVVASGVRSCLVIGKGDGLVPAILASQGVQVRTLDLRTILDPDLVGDVRRLPLRDDAVDMVMCAQVLEHLDFDAFDSCVAELARVAGRAVVTLPDGGRFVEVDARLPRFGRKRWSRRWPGRPKRIAPGHCWELGTTSMDDGKVVDTLRRHFTISEDYNVPRNPYHRFFVLTRSNAPGGEWRHVR